MLIAAPIIGYFIYRREKGKENPCIKNPNGVDRNGNPCVPVAPSNCTGQLTNPSCYACMVPMSQRASTCPSCTTTPPDPSCIDCTMKPRPKGCPKCSDYPDAPGCVAITPTEKQIIKQLQSGWGTLQSNGNCLTVSGNPNNNGTPVILAECIYDDYQLWKMDSDQVFHPKVNQAMCLDEAGDYATAGSPAHIWNCSQSVNLVSPSKDAWIPTIFQGNASSYQLVNNYTPQNCLDASGGVGETLTIETCNPGTSGQFWSFTPYSS